MEALDIRRESFQSLAILPFAAFSVREMECRIHAWTLVAPAAAATSTNFLADADQSPCLPDTTGITSVHLSVFWNGVAPSTP